MINNKPPFCLPITRKCTIIAIEQAYNNFKGLKLLRAPHRDADKLKNFLENDIKFVSDCKLYKDFKFNLGHLYNFILSDIDDLLNNIHQDDEDNCKQTILIAFFGHGAILPNGDNVVIVPV